MSTASFQPTPLYIHQACQQLLWDFPFLAKTAAKSILMDSENHYAIAHDKIINAIRGTAGNNDENKQYKNVKAAIGGKRLEDHQIHNLKAACRQIPPLKHPRRKQYFSSSSNASSSQQQSGNVIMVTEATLVQEVKYVQKKLQQWMEAIQIQQKRKYDKEVSQREGTAVECLCCFDSYPLEDMVACKYEGHLFCCDCLKSYAENLLFGQNNLGMDKIFPQKPALELQCFYSDDCCSGFEREFLKKALPPKTLETYDKIQFEVSLQRAGVQTAKCPKCQFQADVPPGQKIFSCPACAYESCRECGEAAHIPLRYVNECVYLENFVPGCSHY
jgi:TRIAD3 protein (E3 ubiquitin-protein ligase RNF216)